MLTIEVRVNGALVSAMNVVNKRSDGDLSEYEYQSVTFPFSGEGLPKLGNGTVNHWRSEGADMLVRKLYDQLTAKPAAEPK